MNGPEIIAHNETLPASPDLDPDPRTPDGWWEELIDTPQMVVVYPERVSGRLLGLLIVALTAALVAGLLGFAAGRLSAAAPGSAAPAITAWQPIEAPQVDVGSVRSSSSGASSPSVGSLPILDVPIESMTATSPASSSISGSATWYCGGGSPCTAGYGPSDLIAAIDPTLGIERGERLTVHYRGRSVEVVVVDVCACPGGRIIDLSRLAFSQLADPSLGVIPVSIQLSGPAVRLPETDR